MSCSYTCKISQYEKLNRDNLYTISERNLKQILLLEYSSINSKTSHDSGTYMERALLIQSLVNVLPIQDNLFDLNVRNKLVLVKKETYGGI